MVALTGPAISNRAHSNHDRQASQGRVKVRTLTGLEGKYRGVSFSFEANGASSTASLDDLVRGFAFAAAGILAILAIALKSYVRPIIILTAVAFRIVGSVPAYWALGMDLSIFLLCGIATAGVAVNDGLVIVTFIDSYASRRESLMQAA